MTNNITNVLHYTLVSSPVVTHVSTSVPSRSQCAELPKPHAVYDGVVFVIWAFGAYLAVKSICLLISTIKSK